MRSGDADAERVLVERRTSCDRLRRACRGDLDTILEKALKKAPHDRYQTVTAFADDVRRHLSCEPVLARPDSAWYRWRRFGARHRLEFGAAAVVLITLIAGAGVAVWEAARAADQRDRALEQLQRAEAVNDFSSFLLAQARPASGTPLSNAELLKQGETVVDKLFASNPVLRTHMLLLLADRYQENHQYDAWRRVLQRAYDDARGLRDVGLRARATCAWAAQFTEGEEAGRALSAIDEVLPPLFAQPEQSDAISACLQIESRAAGHSGDTARALRSAQRALILEERRGAAATRVYPAVMYLAAAQVAAKQFAAANDAYRRASALIEPQGLTGSLQHAVFLNNWSVMLQNAGQYVEAAAVAKQAVEMARRADSENGASSTILSTWAGALTATGGFDDAASAIEEALVKARAAGSVPRLFNSLGLAIILATESGDLPRAERLLAEARHTQHSDSSPVTRGSLELSEGGVALARGDATGAVAWTRRALDSFASVGPNQASLLTTQTFLARSLNAAGQFGEALTYATRSLATATERLGDVKHSSSIGAAELEVAAARYGLGEVDVARMAVTQAIEHLLASVGPNGPHIRRAERLRAGLPPARQQ